MENANQYELNLESDAFNSFKHDFNKMLRQILLSMEMKEADEGTMSIKFDISLDKESVPDFNSEDADAQREITRPTFKHKITTQITYKGHEEGALMGNFELVWDAEVSSYVLRNIDNGQMSLYDSAESSSPNSAAEEFADLDYDNVKAELVEQSEPDNELESDTGDDYSYEPSEVD